MVSLSTKTFRLVPSKLFEVRPFHESYPTKSTGGPCLQGTHTSSLVIRPKPDIPILQRTKLKSREKGGLRSHSKSEADSTLVPKSPPPQPRTLSICPQPCLYILMGLWELRGVGGYRMMPKTVRSRCKALPGVPAPKRFLLLPQAQRP